MYAASSAGHTDANVALLSAQRQRALEEAIYAAVGDACAPDVTPARLGAIRSAARVCSQAEIRAAPDMLFAQLADENSAQARYLALVVLDDLVMRSVAVRAMVAAELPTVLQQCAGVAHGRCCPLPPPRQSARTLRERALVAMVRWSARFGRSDRRFAMAVRYLRGTPGVEMPDEEQPGTNADAARDVAARRAAAAAVDAAHEVTAALEEHSVTIERCLGLLEAPAAVDAKESDESDWEEYLGGTAADGQDDEEEIEAEAETRAVRAAYAQLSSEAQQLQQRPQSRGGAADPMLLAELEELCRVATASLRPRASTAVTRLGTVATESSAVRAAGSGSGSNGGDGGSGSGGGGGSGGALRALVRARARLDSLLHRCADAGVEVGDGYDGAGDGAGPSGAHMSSLSPPNAATGGRGGNPLGEGGWAEYVSAAGHRRRRGPGIGTGPERTPGGSGGRRLPGEAAANVSHNDLALRAAGAVAAAGGDMAAAEARFQYEQDRAEATAGDAQRARDLQREEAANARRRKRRKTTRERLRERLLSRGSVRATVNEAMADAARRGRDLQR